MIDSPESSAPAADPSPGTAVVVAAPAPVPAAPEPAPAITFQPLVVFMRCTQNPVEDDFHGGTLVLQVIQGQRPEVSKELNDGRLALAAVRDEWLRQFPITRVEKQNRFFRLTVEEVPYTDVPPDPDAPPELFNKDGARVDQHGNLLR